MKKITFALILLFGTTAAFSQSDNLERLIFINYRQDLRPMRQTVYVHDWSNPSFFAQSPKPLVTGYGEFSDSLSKVFQGKTFYANGDDYDQIETWADYYYWLIKKYPYKYINPELYEIYYLSGNDKGMVSYLQKTKYLDDNTLPSLLRFDFREITTSKIKGRSGSRIFVHENNGMYIKPSKPNPIYGNPILDQTNPTQNLNTTNTSSNIEKLD
jgi:hypothetical protein